jgi:hypothetical protein
MIKKKTPYRVNGAINHEGIKQQAITFPWFNFQAYAFLIVIPNIHVFTIL